MTVIEYFQANLWQLWALVCIVCLILELTSGDFFIICFSLGAIAAGIAAATGVSFTAQIIIWVVMATLCIFFVRPFALKYLHKKEEERPSNVDALLGREGTVTDEIEAGGHGRVQIDGDNWKAVSRETSPIAVGQKVRVIGRESIIITVEKVNDNAHCNNR